ncbi:MAG: transglycosylase SLT domain-containing protein [Pseudomonadota bacterium]
MRGSVLWITLGLGLIGVLGFAFLRMQPEPVEEVETVEEVEAPLEGIWPDRGVPWTGDLTGMLERGEIRVLTSYSLGGYFIDRGKQKGLVYETIQHLETFAKKTLGQPARNLRFVIIPVRRDQLLPLLIDGHGDMVAANLRITPGRLEMVDFATPFTNADQESLILGPASPPISRIDDLAGHEVVVREDASYFETLTGLNARFVEEGKAPIEISRADPRLATEDLMQMVDAGLLPMTVADGFHTTLWTQVLENLTTDEALVLHEGGEIAHALRQNSPELKELLSAFAETFQVGKEVPNILLKRYTEAGDWVAHALERDPFRKLDETKALFQKYGEEYGFDWLMLACFALQESGFDQKARNPSGAVGIMQVLPSTATDKSVNVKNIETLEGNIHAGSKYLSVLRSTYFDDPGLDPFEQMLFTMAGYNAGPNRINRLRKEAAKKGLDPNRWFGNVELVVGAKVGREPVKYVGNIYKYYIAYSRTLDQLEDRAKVEEPVLD